MPLTYLRVLGELTPEDLDGAAKAAAAISTMGESGCVLLPPGYALGVLGGAEVVNPLPGQTKQPPTLGLQLVALVLGALVGAVVVGFAWALC